MNPDKIPMSPAALRFKAALQAEGERRGRTEGERNALLMFLGTRGLSPTAEERTMIEDCTDPKKLERWIMRAASAGSVGEVLGTHRKPRTARPRTKQRTRR